MLTLLAATLLAATGSTLQVAEAPARPFDAGLACYSAVKPGAGSLTVDGVFQLVKSRDASMAAEAVDVLARLETPDASAALSLVLCASDDPGLRARAADRFGDRTDAESVWVLAIALENETNAEVRDVLEANLEKAAARQVDPWKDAGAPRALAAAAKRAPRAHRRHRP